METKTLTWSDAIDQAFEPTEFDRAFDKTSFFPNAPKRIGENGKLTDPALIRARAAMRYIEAYEGQEAEVEYADPNQEIEGGRWVYRANGTLKKQYVRVPVFNSEQPNVGGSWDGFIVGGTVVPLEAVSRIRVEGDNSVVVL